MKYNFLLFPLSILLFSQCVRDNGMMEEHQNLLKEMNAMKAKMDSLHAQHQSLSQTVGAHALRWDSLAKVSAPPDSTKADSVSAPAPVQENPW